MIRVVVNELHKEILDNLTKTEFLKKININEEKIQSFVINKKFVNGLVDILDKKLFTCSEVLDLCGDIMNNLCQSQPKNWHKYIYEYVLNKSFSQVVNIKFNQKYESSVLIYLEILRTIFQYVKKSDISYKIFNFDFIKEESENVVKSDEYITFINMFKNNYIYELMKLDEELNRCNLLKYTSIVHNLSMNIGRQCVEKGIKVNLSLLSASAAIQNIGIYPCKYLDIPFNYKYDYTNQLLENYNMNIIARIVNYHLKDTIDVEKLSIESLILMYINYKVVDEDLNDVLSLNFEKISKDVLKKIKQNNQVINNEQMRIYTMMRDFEKYLIYKEIDINIKEYNPYLLEFEHINENNTVSQLKYMIIEHNTSLMSNLYDKSFFTNIIDMARSEKDWKNIKRYLNIFEEYHTYLTQKQKLYIIEFLESLLIYREVYIRKKASALLGKIIVSYDDGYKNQLNLSINTTEYNIKSMDLWKKYLDIFVKRKNVTTKHREWRGYSFSIFVNSVIESADNKTEYLDEIINLIFFYEKEEEQVLYNFNTLLNIPIDFFSMEQLNYLTQYAIKFLDSDKDNIRVISLQFLNHINYYNDFEEHILDSLKHHIENFSKSEHFCVNYLKYKLIQKIYSNHTIEKKYENLINEKLHNIPELMLKNLKSATPWNIKIVSIEYILENKFEYLDYMFQIATHLANIIKVSEQESVRKKAGESLIELGPLLSIDQRNEIAVELAKSLEIDEMQYAKYVPEYLGKFILFLHPKELDEMIIDLQNMCKNTNFAGALAIDTLGIIVENYSKYKSLFEEKDENYNNRLRKILGIILSGLANYNEQVKQETFLVLGKYIFDTEIITLQEKHFIFSLIYKKLFSLLNEKELSDTFYFYNASSFNNIYRFINQYIINYGDFKIIDNKKIAFFPGTFDPFSLSHKKIVTEIRDLGYEVYIDIDELYWLKRLQPKLIRRQIINMSIADELDIFMFPDDILINLSNPDDLKILKNYFDNRNITIVVGSDTILNALSYKSRTTKHSIHNLDHIIYKCMLDNVSYNTEKKIEEAIKRIKGNIINLNLPIHFEDEVSDKIRNLIDENKDVSSLIDTLAQRYIYDKNLYIREPQYKSIVKYKPFKIEIVEDLKKNIVDEIGHYIFMHTNIYNNIAENLISKKISLMVVRDKNDNNKIIGFSAFHQISTSDVYLEFRSQYIANYLRDKAAGRLVVVDGIFVNPNYKYDNLEQIIVTETLAYCLKNDYTYAVYNNILTKDNNDKIHDILELQGFEKIQDEGFNKITYVVDMKFPICLTLNVENFIKPPFSTNASIKEAITKTRESLQKSLVNLYPGSLVLSFDTDMINQVLIEKICRMNNMDDDIYKSRISTNYMCVPFGNFLKGKVVPDTITKSIHTEKMYTKDAKYFNIKEYPFYSSLENQVKAIKSFDIPVILVDDLLNKGYRIKGIAPILKKQNIKVEKTIVGIMSGRGKDLMDVQGSAVDCAYFIPNLRLWFNENLMYPFIGGDGVLDADENMYNLIPSYNLILPYIIPSFVKGTTKESIYNLSMTCLNNTKYILKVLEEEYQRIYSKTLILKRLGEVLTSPRIPYLGKNILYNLNAKASSYIDEAITTLEKLEKIIK